MKMVTPSSGLRRPLIMATLLVSVLGALGGCSSRPPYAQTTTVGGKGPVDFQAELPADVFTVPEIPIAPNSEIIKEDTVIVGSDDSWTGQVVLRAPFRVAQMTEFYRKEMPRFGWSETSIVRARRAAITFTKAQRVVIVRISAVSDSESEVDLVVSPNVAASDNYGRNQTGAARPSPPLSSGSSIPTPRSKPN